MVIGNRIQVLYEQVREGSFYVGALMEQGVWYCRALLWAGDTEELKKMAVCLYHAVSWQRRWETLCSEKLWRNLYWFKQWCFCVFFFLIFQLCLFLVHVF